MPYIYNDEDNNPMIEDMTEDRKCYICKNHDGKECQVWDCKFERREQAPAGKNCHERCRYSKQCWETFKCKGENRADFPDECALYYKIDDLMLEAQDIPFFDPDAIPEEEEALEDDG